MDSGPPLKVGCRVQVTTKEDVKIATVAFVGATSFAPGKFLHSFTAPTPVSATDRIN